MPLPPAVSALIEYLTRGQTANGDQGVPRLSPWPQANRPPQNDLPPEGPMYGLVQANRGQLPQVPQGAARPFGPQEFVTNPSGGWSSEVSITVTDPRLNGGKATVIPSVWMVGGMPRRVSEDQAVDFAVRSGLQWQPHASIDAAETWVTERHKGFDTGQSVAPLWKQK